MNGRSKLINDTNPEPPNEWSSLPYGPYPQKKFAWDKKAKSLVQIFVPSAQITVRRENPDGYIVNNDALAAKIKAEHDAAEKYRQE